MERAARQLLVFSLFGFVAVVALGTVRASPVHRVLDTSDDVVRALGSFHAHFDALVWVGAAALGGVLHVLRDRYRGPAWAPRFVAPAYGIGSVVFSGAYAVKGLLLRLGLERAGSVAGSAIASAGGCVLLAAAACVAVIGWGVLARRDAGVAAE